MGVPAAEEASHSEGAHTEGAVPGAEPRRVDDSDGGGRRDAEVLEHFPCLKVDRTAEQKFAGLLAFLQVTTSIIYSIKSLSYLPSVRCC